jgi:hypothetical protein
MMFLPGNHVLRAGALAALVLAFPAALAHAQPADDTEVVADEDSAPEPAYTAPDDVIGTEPSAPGPVVNADAPVLAPAAAVEGGSAGYDKGFYIRASEGDFLLRTEARVQGRFTGVSEAAGDTREDGANFRINRARLTLGGHAFSKNIGYKFQTDFGKGDVILKDFYIDYEIGGVHIRTGQWKRPFSRQQINSSGSLELVDRAITDKAFDAGRDIGVAVHNDYEKSPAIEWAVGVFNAQTADKPIFDAGKYSYSNYPGLFGPAVVARVGINQGGIKGYSEADLEGGPLRLAVASSVLADIGMESKGQGAVLAEADFIVKHQGLSTTGGVYVSTAEGADGFFDQSRNILGFHLQAGYMLTRQHQVALRYALVNKPDAVVPDATINDTEIVIGHSMYTFKHNFKWQTDIGILALNGAELGDAIEVRSQLQLAF